MMTPLEGDTVLALLRHLDGSQVLDETDLVPELVILYQQVSHSTRPVPPLDEDVLLSTLGEVAQRFADAGL